MFLTFERSTLCSRNGFCMCNSHCFQKSELPRGTGLTSSGIRGWRVNLDSPHKPLPWQERWKQGCYPLCAPGAGGEQALMMGAWRTGCLRYHLACAALVPLFYLPFPLCCLTWLGFFLFPCVSKQMNQLVPRYGGFHRALTWQSRGGRRWQKAHPDPAAIPCQASGSCSEV